MEAENFINNDYSKLNRESRRKRRERQKKKKRFNKNIVKDNSVENLLLIMFLILIFLKLLEMFYI
jgi:hypothetical protein